MAMPEVTTQNDYVEDRIYLAEMPPSYAELRALAEQHIDPALPYDQQVGAAAMVIEAAKAQPVEESEAARSYALGLLTPLIGEIFADDDRRAKLIHYTAHSLAAAHQTAAREMNAPAHRGLLLGECARDIRSDGMKTAHEYTITFLRTPVLDRYHQLPMAERLTANALTCAFLKNLETRSLRFRPRTLTQEVELALHAHPVIHSLLPAAFGGAARLLMAAFLKKTGLATGQEEKLYPRPLADYFTDEELRALIPVKTAMRGARARMDQLQLPRLCPHATLAKGALVLEPFPNPAGPLPPATPDSPVFLHEATYACAALAARVAGAEGKPQAFVQLAFPILAEILVLAQQLLRQQYEG